MTKRSQQRASRIERRLQDLLREEGQRWQRVALLLLEVQAGELWSGRSPSFTSWLRDQAERSGVGAKTLFRYLSAGRFYEKVRKGRNAPPLGRGQENMSAMTLELAQRISAVAPKRVADRVIDGAMSGKLSQREARAIWRSYQPALKGGHRRGRGTTSLRPDSALAERGTMLQTLRAAGASWVPDLSGAVDAVVYEDVALPLAEGRSEMIDAAILVEGPDRLPVVHAVHIWRDDAGDSPSTRRLARELLAATTPLWIAVAGGQPGGLPSGAGVIEVHGTGVRVRRVAKTKGAGSRALERALLARLSALGAHRPRKKRTVL